ncbi:conserved exported hypothetical protein [Tenacibaculum litoreum]|uniref:hypothetical protein n=1 Tax=Tenacibaculum TaxID=104267 RepID=UPI0038952A19
MKKLKYVFAIGLGVALLTSCSSSASDDFDEVNGEAKKKRLKTVAATNQENETITTQFMYNAEKELVSISGTNGTDATLINYNNNGSTIKVTEDSDPSESLSIEELYQSPYNIYETGMALEYDSNKNPSKVLFQVEVYDWETEMNVVKSYTAEMFYDDKPNMYFSTLESAGVIEILDGVDVSFGVNPQASEVIKARRLLPLNNVTKIIYKDADDNVIGTLTVDYTYDSDGYPLTGKGLAVGGEESIAINATYSYE